MITTVNTQNVKTHLSRVVEQADKRDEFVMAKVGKPMVLVDARGVVPLQPPPVERSLSSLKGQGVGTAD